MNRRPGTRSILGIAAYAMLCLIWGSTWLVIKVGYGGLGPFNVAALRFLIAGLVMAIVVPISGARWPQGASEWRLVGIVGVLMFAGDYGLIYWSEQYIDSSLTAILFAVLPLLTICIAHRLLPGERITARTLGGTLLAFAGAVALFGDRVSIDPAGRWPMLAVIAATACAAAASVASKRSGAALHPASLNAPAMLIGGVVLSAVSLGTGERVTLPRDVATWGAVLYLALAGSVFTFLVYFWLLKTWTVTSLSFISVFTPAIALVLGYVFLDEQPTVWTAVGGALIIAGVVLAIRRPSRVSPAVSSDPRSA
jgi:drug/metabolite transporter (DMT)-like permease